MLAKHIGSKMNRSIRLAGSILCTRCAMSGPDIACVAVESKTYHVMFPPTEAPDASPGGHLCYLPTRWISSAWY